MCDVLFALNVKLQNLINSEEGQDLIEYGLLVSLIACGAIGSFGHVATAVTKLFTNISTTVG